jgi:cell division protein FtsX
MRQVAAVALVAAAAGCAGSHAALLPQRCRLGVYFRPNATAAQEDSVRRKLQSDRHATRLVFVSKEEAFQLMRQRHPALVGQVRMNPFPDALYVHPRTRADYAPIVRSLQPRPPCVATVHYPRFGPCGA